MRPPAGLNDGVWSDVDLLYGTSFICLMWGSGAGWVDAGLRIRLSRYRRKGIPILQSKVPTPHGESHSNRPVFKITLCKAGLHERRGPQGV